MKKSLLSLVALTAVLAITGCNNGSSSSPKQEESKGATILDIEAIDLSSNSKAMLVGEQYAIETLVTPLLAVGQELVYKSENASIASVNKDGVVTAKKQGNTKITVSSKKDPEIKAEMLVYVLKSQDASNVRDHLSDMEAYQKKYVTAPRKLRTYEVETRSRYVNGELRTQMVGYDYFITAKDDAYFYVGGRDTESRTFNAPAVRSSFGYHIFTDNDYHSYIYHENDNSKNRCYVASEFYLGTGTTQDQVVDAILDSLFTSGKKISENNIEDSMGTDWFEYSSLCKQGGYDNDSVYAIFTQSIPRSKADAELEQNLDIPAGVYYSEKDQFACYYHKGNVKYYFVNFQISYAYQGVNHVLDIKREYTFERDDEFSFSFPNPSDYQEVADIFDL